MSTHSSNCLVNGAGAIRYNIAAVDGPNIIK